MQFQNGLKVFFLIKRIVIQQNTYVRVKLFLFVDRTRLFTDFPLPLLNDGRRIIISNKNILFWGLLMRYKVSEYVSIRYNGELDELVVYIVDETLKYCLEEVFEITEENVKIFWSVLNLTSMPFKNHIYFNQESDISRARRLWFSKFVNIHLICYNFFFNVVGRIHT